uniref:Si:dkey-24p1.6 n=1 Tax=Amphilophus citrinellus TaxID=61819 RepID=A0A3Q0T214_AMPCI
CFHFILQHFLLLNFTSLHPISHCRIFAFTLFQPLNHLLEVLYSCDEPATVQLDCVVSFETGTISTHLLRRWACVPGDTKIRAVKLNLPDWLVYRADGIVPDSHWVLSCILRASVRHSGYGDTEKSVRAQHVAALEPKPYLSRRVKQHQLCIAWAIDLWASKFHLETVHLLSSIYASTGERFGITKTLDPHRSEVLEYSRIRAISFPWCTFSIWLYVTTYCQEALCGIFHHIDSQNNYVTPALLLTNSGHLHIQMNGESVESSAFLSAFKVPLNEWCNLIVMFYYPDEKNTTVTLHTVLLYNISYRFRFTIILDDTEGYFVIGGGKYIRGVEGYFGPVVYHRNRILPGIMVLLVLLLTLQCFSYPLLICLLHLRLIISFFSSLTFTFQILSRIQTWPGGCRLSFFNFCSIYSHISKCMVQAWLLGLLGAQRDDRLALLHLGHLHQQGLQGQPVDPDLAYAYYANIAHQTTLDRHNPSPQQTTVEPIFLNNDEVLNIQTNENHHIFQWLKHQARKGVTEAEQAIARMLFWGQQGVTPNIQEAVRHYERGAVQWEDPVSMYDYGIVLLQGHGVKKDVSKGITFLKKAMDKGHVPAMNALAWYYEQFEKDYKQAVQLWEQADLLMCPEAALNLGVIYSQGLYPGKAANQYMAYKYYLKSAERGNIRGGILIADIWTTGMPGFVNRHPSDAVLWVKWAAEHNGYLGSILRKALDAYLKNDMFMSLLYYLMAAESGYAAAQFNVAYLCEQNSVNCMWRYYNLTIQSQNPNTYGKMGDLFYERRGNRQKNLFSAVQMYTQAALRSNPQGWYNLGLLAEEGYKLPLSTLTALGLSELYLADKDLDSEDTDSFFPCSLALFNRSWMSFLESAGAILPFWGSLPRVFQLIRGPLLPSPSTSSPAVLSALGISRASCVPSS